MLSIVIPTYNEIQNLQDFIELTIRTLDDQAHEIIIVDDNSPDGTGVVADRLKDRYSSIKVIQRAKKLGIASAIIEASRIARGSVIITLNGDFQHPPQYLKKIIRYIPEYDLVIASKYSKHSDIKDSRFLRYIASKIATYLVYFFIPKLSGIRDPLSGYFAFRKTVIKNVSMNHYSSKCLMHILVKGAYKNVIEIPYSFQRRRHGTSKFSLFDCFTFLKDLSILSQNPFQHSGKN